MLDYLVLYESETGNTKKIATEIFSALPGMSKDLIHIHERDTLPEAAVYFVGFCVHSGTCSLEIGRFLSSLSGKAVALFGTCGQGNCAEYYSRIENSARIWLEDDTEYLGGFFCQGKMPLLVRKKYEQLLLENVDSPNTELAAGLRLQLRNFDEAMVHPDKADLIHSKEFTALCLGRLPSTDQP